MAMTLRADKGAILSWNEMDANFRACMGIHNLLHVQDRKATTVAPSQITSGAWRTRELNHTLTANITGASLASNQITLPAGIYFIDASSPVYSTDWQIARNQARVYNVTIGSILVLSGSSLISAYTANNAILGISKMKGVFQLSVNSVIEIQHYAGATGLGGMNANTGQPEIYTDVLIWKLA